MAVRTSVRGQALGVVEHPARATRFNLPGLPMPVEPDECSSTYRSPSGPNSRPRGLFSPLANTGSESTAAGFGFPRTSDLVN